MVSLTKARGILLGNQCLAISPRLCRRSLLVTPEVVSRSGLHKRRKMRILANIIALVVVLGLLALLLWVGPSLIVESEWREEQSSTEKDKITAIRLKGIREEYVGRAQRAFNYSVFTEPEIADFLVDYSERVKSLYQEYVSRNKFADLLENPKIEFDFPNIFVLLISYALTTGYANVPMKSSTGMAITAVISYIAMTLIAITIAAMCQIYMFLLRTVMSLIMGTNKTDAHPDRLSHEFVWCIAKRDMLVFVVCIFIAVGAVIGGAAIIRYDQRDWTWGMALIFAQAGALSAGHTKYAPDPLEADLCTVKYGLFFLALHVWMQSFVALLLCSLVTAVESVYNTQFAEITDAQILQLEESIERRKRQRKFENPVYEG